ncbi:MAG: Holliday junction branch migration DNA helicase RuvB [Chloroflexi bacterium]|nr:Holliday junction branch migration DNA helicase RuvB [Chloroflexota bacterium]
MADRLVSPKAKEEDLSLDNSLRPKRLDDFVGQTKVKENLKIAIAAAKMRGEALDHVLFYGPPGLGKTTLANVIAHEMGSSVKVTSGAAIERQGDLAAILSTIHKGDILFVDEIHRLSHIVEEFLYPAMEDFVIDIVIGKGPGAQSIRLSLPHFTVIGATTRYAMLTAPLRNRFGNLYRLDFYDEEAIHSIVTRSARILAIEIDEVGAREIAVRSRGTPRVANRLLRRVRDYAQVKGRGVIDRAIAGEALSRLEVDHLGLDEIDRRVLLAIVEKFEGGPVGLETIAASISEEADTIMDVYEPYLLQLGFINRTPRGRVATRLAYEHLGLAAKSAAPPAQRTLW